MLLRRGLVTFLFTFESLIGIRMIIEFRGLCRDCGLDNTSGVYNGSVFSFMCVALLPLLKIF